MRPPNQQREHDPNADTLLPGSEVLRTSTPLSSTLNKVPAPETTPSTIPQRSKIPKIATAIVLAAATAIGAHKCASGHDNPEISEYNVASSLGEIEKVSEVLIEGDLELPEPTNPNEALEYYIRRNEVTITADNFDTVFKQLPEATNWNNKYIQILRLSEYTSDEGAIQFQWQPINEKLTTCEDPSACIYAIRAKKDRYRGLITFRKQYKPGATFRDKNDPNILYVAFDKPGYSSINVEYPGKPGRNLFLTRITIKKNPEFTE